MYWPWDDATHALVVSESVVGTDGYDRVVRAAFEAAAAHADEFAVWLDRGAVAEQYPGVVDDVEAAFERAKATDAAEAHDTDDTDDADEAYDADDADEADDAERALDAFASLLGTEGFARGYGIRELGLSTGGEPCLRYVVDRTSVQCSAAAAPGVADAIAAAVVEEPAVLVPTATIASWESGRTGYEIAGEWLHAGPVQHGLGALRGVEADPRTLTIELAWERQDVGRVLSALASAGRAAFRVLGWHQPETVRFRTTPAFEEVRDALEGIVAGFEGERGRV